MFYLSSSWFFEYLIVSYKVFRKVEFAVNVVFVFVWIILKSVHFLTIVCLKKHDFYRFQSFGTCVYYLCTKHINKNGRGKMKLFNYQYSVVTKLHGKKPQHLVLVGISLMIISHVFFLLFLISSLTYCQNKERFNVSMYASNKAWT